MPKGTAQTRKVNHKTGAFYNTKNVLAAENEFIVALKPYAPAMPSDKPIKLTVWFAFDTKNKKYWCKDVPDAADEWSGYSYKPTRPDTDNYLKLFKDCMTKAGFWKDDAQVVDERVIKTYAEKATIMVMWEEILDKSESSIRR
jgi:Holliday junction resolvase RusA-like endonuclease